MIQSFANLCLSQKNLDGASAFKAKLEKLALQSMDRAEALKTEQNLNSLSQLDISNLLDKQKPSQSVASTISKSQDSSKIGFS